MATQRYRFVRNALIAASTTWAVVMSRVIFPHLTVDSDESDGRFSPVAGGRRDVRRRRAPGPAVRRRAVRTAVRDLARRTAPRPLPVGGARRAAARAGDHPVLPRRHRQLRAVAVRAP